MPIKCEICDLEKDGGKKFFNHHVKYVDTGRGGIELTSLLCARCHLWLGGTSRVFKHPFITKYGKDLGPYMFAKAICSLYERKFVSWLYENALKEKA